MYVNESISLKLETRNLKLAPLEPVYCIQFQRHVKREEEPWVRRACVRRVLWRNVCLLERLVGKGLLQFVRKSDGFS